jgi:hypothetical protein
MAMGDPGFFMLLAAGLLLLPTAARTHDADSMNPWNAAGSLVRLSVEVDGRTAPLYPSPDGSSRRYVEARRGSAYAVRIENRSSERMGVVVNVDGLNVISGIEAAAAGPGRSAGRMYILDPWGETVVRGWRTSLEAVRAFTFVEEGRSYAARSGKMNPRMGWIELAVFRERRPYVVRWPLEPRLREGAHDGPSKSAGNAAPHSRPGAPEAADSLDGSDGYPGTGWGTAREDRAEVVSFDPCPTAAERLTVRYEYASALRALGILPRQDVGRDRLRERERGEWGFAAPPAW